MKNIKYSLLLLLLPLLVSCFDDKSSDAKSRIVTHTYDRRSKKSRIHSLSVRNIVLWDAETAPSGRIFTKTLPDGRAGDFTNLLFPLIRRHLAHTLSVEH